MILSIGLNPGLSARYIDYQRITFFTHLITHHFCAFWVRFFFSLGGFSKRIVNRKGYISDTILHFSTSVRPVEVSQAARCFVSCRAGPPDPVCRWRIFRGKHRKRLFAGGLIGSPSTLCPVRSRGMGSSIADGDLRKTTPLVLSAGNVLLGGKPPYQHQRAN